MMGCTDLELKSQSERAKKQRQKLKKEGPEVRLLNEVVLDWRRKIVKGERTSSRGERRTSEEEASDKVARWSKEGGSRSKYTTRESCLPNKGSWKSPPNEKAQGGRASMGKFRTARGN